MPWKFNPSGLKQSQVLSGKNTKKKKKNQKIEGLDPISNSWNFEIVNGVFHFKKCFKIPSL